ncbi:transcription factor kayak isoform X1 [Calliphora vicina]|uniref:transcription factor kayak isoform X1 n=1 Tax=Calliphora vicina TaxID=7373 RepID=UPI00325B641C
MKNLNIKQYHQAYHPYEIPANTHQHQPQFTNPYNNTAVATTTPTNQRFNFSNSYNLPPTTSTTNSAGCKTLQNSINNRNNNNQNLPLSTSAISSSPPTLGGYLANQQQQRLQQQQQHHQQLQQHFNQRTQTAQQINMLSLNQTNTFNYNFHFNANNNNNNNHNNNTSHNLNINNNNNSSNTKYNHNNSALSRPQRPNSLNISAMASLATPSYSCSSTASMSNEPSSCHSAPTTGGYNFTPNHFYNNQRENLFNFPISQQQQQQQQHHQQLQQHHNNHNYNVQQQQHNYNNYQTNQQQQQQLQQFQLLQQQLKQQQLHINNNNSSNSNNCNLTTPAVSSSASLCSSSATTSSCSPCTNSSNNALATATTAVAAVNSNTDQSNTNNNCDKLTMDACEIANFLANELFMQQLVSMECMQTGVPTLTTPTLTPTTLKSIEESFIQLTSEPMNAPYQAGFIPPPLGSYNATTTNTINNNSNNNNNNSNSTLTATTTSVAGISPNAALNNVYLGDISAGASLPDYGNMTESENSQGSWTGNHLNEENSMATTDTSSAATDTISFQNGLNGLGVNTLNNSNSSTTNDFTTVNLAALAVATAAAKISGNHNNNTSSSATTTATPTRRGGGRRPATNSNISPEEEEKRRIRRERNKLAAARCRKRRVDQTNELTDEVQLLEKKREELQKQIESLNGTKQDLEFLLEAHRPTCQRVVATDILSVNAFEGLMPSATSTVNDNITGMDTSLATTARSISPLDLKPVLSDQLLAQIKAEPLDSALDSNSSLDQDGPPSSKRYILSNNNPMIPPPLPNVATLSASLAAASASLNTPIVTTAPVSFGSMYSNNPSLSAPLTKPNSKQRPNSLPTVPRNLAQNLGLNVNDNKPPTDINGVAIQTPSTGMFNFDSLMDGGTGLTPVSGPLVPNCSSQNKHPLELVTPTSEPSKLVSL